MNTLSNIADLSDSELSEMAKNFLLMHETGIRPTSDVVDTWLSGLKREIPIGPSALSILESAINREVVKRFVKTFEFKNEESDRLKRSLKVTEDFFNSEEGEKSVREFIERQKIEEEILNKHIERFKQKCQHRLDDVIEILIKKYDSNKYVSREYRLGYQPRETLFWLLLEYSKKYGSECTDQKYWNDFTGEAYYVGSYVIQVMHGQGSVIRIDRVYLTEKV